MKKILRANVDTAGGVITSGSPNVFINGEPVVRIGDLVAYHGNSPHNNAVMIEGSSNVFVNNIAVCREGDHASCGHIGVSIQQINVGN